MLPIVKEMFRKIVVQVGMPETETAIGTRLMVAMPDSTRNRLAMHLTTDLLREYGVLVGEKATLSPLQLLNARGDTSLGENAVLTVVHANADKGIVPTIKLNLTFQELSARQVHNAAALMLGEQEAREARPSPYADSASDVLGLLKVCGLPVEHVAAKGDNFMATLTGTDIDREGFSKLLTGLTAANFTIPGDIRRTPIYEPTDGGKTLLMIPIHRELRPQVAKRAIFNATSFVAEGAMPAQPGAWSQQSAVSRKAGGGPKNLLH